MELTPTTVTALIIFAVTFILILSERIHRTVIAMFGATVMLLAGIGLDFYHPPEAVQALDFNTLGLLFGMMLLVTLLEQTGALQYLAILSAKKTRGNPWRLLVVLGAVTTIVSCFLDNVTTIILIAPVSIIIARIVNISPTPILMAEALLSNTGGVATLVGDPPNIMIGSAAGFSFIDFLTHVAPIVFVTWLVLLFTLKLVFRKELQQKPEGVEELLQWDEKSAIEDMRTCKKVVAVLVGVVVLFFLHHILHLPPALVAILGASIALLLITATKDPQPILAKVEWSVLMFFAALFILVGGLEQAGILESVAVGVTEISGQNPVMSALLVLWVGAFVSAVVDNIPFTMAMIPVIQHLQGAAIPTDLLWWALAMGVGFGGNGSPIGSTASVVVVSRSEETSEPITFARWFKSGTIAMIVSCLVGSVAIVLFHEWLAR